MDEKTDRYTGIWTRFRTLLAFEGKDIQDIFTHLHPEVQAGLRMMVGIASQEIEAILEHETWDGKDEYLHAATTLSTASVLGGYLLGLIEHDINPMAEHTGAGVERLGEAWMTLYREHKLESETQGIEPLIDMMLSRIGDLRVNQLLSMHPSMADKPYALTERVHQFIYWSGRQGYVLGKLERDLATATGKDKSL